MDPLYYSTFRIKPNLYQVIFDKLFMFTQLQDKQYVEKLLEKYSECLGSLTQHDNQPKISGGTIIMLCEKFGYYSKELFEQIYNHFIIANLNLKPMSYPLSLRKNAANFHYQLCLRIYEIGAMLRLTIGKNQSQENQLREIFNQKLERMFNRKTNQIYTP